MTTTFDHLFPGRRGQAARPRILKTYVGLGMAVEPDFAWSPDDVRFRLGEAIQVVQRAVRRGNPKQFGSAWPDFQIDYPEIDPTRGRPPSAAEISRAEEALGWQVQFLAFDEVMPMRRALRMWLVCKALRHPFRAACRVRGLPYSTAQRLAGEACMVAAVGLMRASKPIDDATLRRKEVIADGWTEPKEEDEDARTVAFV